MPRLFTFAAVVLAVALSAGFFTSTVTGRSASASHTGGMDAMSIDMDPSAAPANTGTSLGSQELGARVNENNLLDVDEDATDQLEIDVTADGVPVGFEMVGFTAFLTYSTPPAPNLCIVADDYNFKLTLPFPASEPTPDCNGSFNVVAVELDPVFQSGDGVLARLTLETQAGVQPGVYPLTLESAAHVDPLANDHAPDAVNNAYICIDAACDDLDGDGVLNIGDDCPYTPPAEPVDPNGCTEADVDEDFDGICDPGVTSTLCSGEDACPEIFGPPENDGCPLAGPPAVGGTAGLLDGSGVDAASVNGGGAPAPVAALAAVSGAALVALASGLALALRRIR